MNTEEQDSTIDLSWRDHAACIGKSEYFFNDNMASMVRKAKDICAVCVVKTKCLEYAMTHHEYGLWGGLTANERRHIRRAGKHA
jgi:WhiB family redox-sensing transcriptional regulator